MFSTKLSAFWPKLRASWRKLRASWRKLRASWWKLRASWCSSGAFWCSSGAFWCSSGAFWCPNSLENVPFIAFFVPKSAVFVRLCRQTVWIVYEHLWILYEGLKPILHKVTISITTRYTDLWRDEYFYHKIFFWNIISSWIKCRFTVDEVPTHRQHPAPETTALLKIFIKSLGNSDFSSYLCGVITNKQGLWRQSRWQNRLPNISRRSLSWKHGSLAPLPVMPASPTIRPVSSSTAGVRATIRDYCAASMGRRLSILRCSTHRFKDMITLSP